MDYVLIILLSFSTIFALVEIMYKISKFIYKHTLKDKTSKNLNSANIIYNYENEKLEKNMEETKRVLSNLAESVKENNSEKSNEMTSKITVLLDEKHIIDEIIKESTKKIDENLFKFMM